MSFFKPFETGFAKALAIDLLRRHRRKIPTFSS